MRATLLMCACALQIGGGMALCLCGALHVGKRRPSGIPDSQSGAASPPEFRKPFGYRALETLDTAPRRAAGLAFLTGTAVLFGYGLLRRDAVLFFGEAAACAFVLTALANAIPSKDGD